MALGSKKGTQIHFSFLSNVPGKQTPSRVPNRDPIVREARLQGILNISQKPHFRVPQKRSPPSKPTSLQGIVCSFCYPACRAHAPYYIATSCLLALHYFIYLLTAIGLTPGGSSTVHIYTQTVHRTTQNKQYIQEHNQHKQYTGCHRRNGPNFGRVFLMLKYTDITQNTYIQS